MYVQPGDLHVLPQHLLTTLSHSATAAMRTMRPSSPAVAPQFNWMLLVLVLEESAKMMSQLQKLTRDKVESD